MVNVGDLWIETSSNWLVALFLLLSASVLILLFQDGAEHGSRVASSEKTLQFFVCFICYFVVLRVGCC